MDDTRLERIERRMDELDQRSSAMERTLERAMERSKAAMATVIPSQTRGHMRAAWREQLLAVRSMIDFWADKLSDDSSAAADKSDSAGNGGRHNIPIE